MSPVINHDVRTRCDICLHIFKNIHSMRLHRARCVEGIWGMNKSWWQRKSIYSPAGKMAKRYRRFPSYGELIGKFSNMNLYTNFVRKFRPSPFMMNQLQPITVVNPAMNHFNKFFAPVMNLVSNNNRGLPMVESLAHTYVRLNVDEPYARKDDLEKSSHPKMDKWSLAIGQKLLEPNFK